VLAEHSNVFIAISIGHGIFFLACDTMALLAFSVVRSGIFDLTILLHLDSIFIPCCSRVVEVQFGSVRFGV